MRRRLARAWLLLIPAACSPERELTLPAVLHITTRDFAFETSDSVAAGRVRLTMRNAGPSYHHVQLVRINLDISWQQAIDSLPEDGSLLPWMIAVGGIEGPDDYSLAVTVDLDLTPGLHLLICRIYASDGRAHSAHGMARPLHVVATERSGGQTDLAGEVTVGLLDYAFAAPDTIRSAVRSLRIENRGREDHHIAIARFAPGKSLPDALIEQSPTAPPTYTVLGGTAALAPGMRNILHVSLDPGRYVLLCFVLNRTTSVERHYQMGMIRALTVIP